MWSFWSVFFGACSLGLFFCFCFVAPSNSSSFSVIVSSYSSCAQVSPCRSLFCAYTYLLHHSVVAVSFLASSYHTSLPLHSPHFLGLASVSFIDWSFTHSFLDSTISFGSLLLVTFIHSHLHLIFFPVVIVISAQYHNTNFALLFSFHVPSSYQLKCG